VSKRGSAQRRRIREERRQLLRVGKLGEGGLLIGNGGLQRVGLAVADGVPGFMLQPRSALKRRIFRSDSVGPRFRRRREKPGEAVQPFLADILGPRGHRQSAFGADCAQQHIDDQGAAAREEGIGVAGGPPARMPDDPRRSFREGPRQSLDVGGRDSGRGFGRLRRERSGQAAQLVQVSDPPLAVGGIVQRVFQKDVHHGHVQNIIGPGPDEKEPVGLAGGHRGADVDDGEPAAVSHGVQKVVGLRDVDRLEQVARL
jgi:hypothetical protein